MPAITNDFLQQKYHNIQPAAPTIMKDIEAEKSPEDPAIKYFKIMRSSSQQMSKPFDQSEGLKALLQPFRFALNASDYRTWKEQIDGLIASQFDDQGKYLGVDRIGYVKPKELLGQLYADDTAFSSYSFADTSLGGNEAINCRWGFCRDDDIIQPINAFEGKPYLGGLGRVYYEQYESQAQYLYITAGVPEFNYIDEFYSDAINMQLASDVNNGGWTGGVLAFIGSAVGSLISGGISLAKTAIGLPFMSLKYLNRAIDTMVGNRTAVTKYYDFRSAMPQYYRYVNSMLVHICTNLGLYPALTPGDDNQYGKQGLTGTHKNVSAADVMGLSDRVQDKNKDKVPQFLKEGISIYRILSKRSYRNGINEALIEGSKKGRDPADVALEYHNNYMKSNRGHLEAGDESEGWWTTFKRRFRATATGADMFICFRLDKGTEASETFTNSTGQSAIQQTLNGMVQQGKNLQFSAMGGRIADIPIIGGIISGVTKVAQGILGQFSFTNMASAITTGSGFFDIPEVWQSSSYNKSYSFSMTFRAPYGDSTSIAQSLYVPLSMLLPLVLPRSVGQNSYTSPFIVRAYAKGMFSIPLGIIDSMQITRGAQEFGWNINKLPLVLKINFSIKDLSPLVHMSFRANGGLMDAIFGSNSNFQEYLMDLEGLGIQERLLFFSSFWRRLEIWANERKQTLGSPLVYLGTLVGNMGMTKLLMNFSRQSQLP